MGRLEGRVAVVTGASRGIGAATADVLASNGAAVMITDVLIEQGEALAQKLRDSGAKAIFRKHDVSSEDDWRDALAQCESELGGLDILVNNAGTLLIKPLLETSLTDFQAVQKVNVEGCFLGMKLAVPLIAKRSAQWSGGGSIINLSSVAGLIGSPSAVAYCASKGAIRLMTKAVALECAALGFKIRVNSVHPGRVATDMLEQAMQELEPGQVREGLPVATPDNIASAIAFLASDDAAFVTGSELVVDGGFTAQ